MKTVAIRYGVCEEDCRANLIVLFDDKYAFCILADELPATNRAFGFLHLDGIIDYKGLID